MLGLMLNYATDSFEVKVHPPAEVETKRQILQVMYSIFNPLGFLAAPLLPAKLIMQDVCLSSADWDEPLDLATPRTLERMVKFSCDSGNSTSSPKHPKRGQEVPMLIQ